MAQKTYSNLQNQKRKPSEYEIVSSNLLYYLKQGFEVNVPLKQWYDKYQTQSPLKCKNWEQFYDPRETTYAKYTIIQNDQEIFVDGIFQSVATTGYDCDLSPSWVGNLARILPVLRYPWHGLQMIASYMGQMAPSGRIVIACVFQTADEMRRIQRVAYRMCQLQKHHANFGQDSQTIWEQDPLWQPLREVIEQLLITYDWSEAFIALNLVLKPLLDRFFMIQFSHLAKKEGDYLLAEIFFSLYKDCQWHQEWSTALVRMIIEDFPENQRVILHSIKKWYPFVFRAVSPMVHFFENTFCCDSAKISQSKLAHDYQLFLQGLGLETEITA